jgi:hypothetical protein
MKLQGQWEVQTVHPGFTWTYRPVSKFANTLTLDIPPSAVSDWSAALGKVVRRLEAVRFRSIPLMLGMRCLLGCWGNARRIQCFGRLPKQKCHIIGVEESLFLIVEMDGWSSYPISRHDLKEISSRLV